MLSLRPRCPVAILCLFALLQAACQTPQQTADLASNEELYVDLPFVTRVPGDRAVFLTPVADQRAQTAATLPAQQRGFPIRYSSEQVWDRPVVAMVGEVLERQLRDSKLFTAVSEAPRADGLVVIPTLQRFHCGTAESISGSSSFAEVALRLQVYGPVGNDGKRPLLLEQVYGDRQQGETMFQPITPYRLLGPALRSVVGEVLASLDGSNVSRSLVPLATAMPASYFELRGDF